MTPATLTCPKCRAQFVADPSQLGAVLNCPSCGARVGPRPLPEADPEPPGDEEAVGPVAEEIPDPAASEVDEEEEVTVGERKRLSKKAGPPVWAGLVLALVVIAGVAAVWIV